MSTRTSSSTSLRLEVNPPPPRTLERAAWHRTDPRQLPKGNQKARGSEQRRLDLLIMHSRTELLEISFTPPALIKYPIAVVSEGED